MQTLLGEQLLYVNCSGICGDVTVRITTCDGDVDLRSVYRIIVMLLKFKGDSSLSFTFGICLILLYLLLQTAITRTMVDP